MPETDGADNVFLNPLRAYAFWSSGDTLVTQTSGPGAGSGASQAGITWTFTSTGPPPHWQVSSGAIAGSFISDVFPPQPIALADGDFRGDPPDGFVDPFDLAEQGSTSWTGSLHFAGQNAVYNLQWERLPDNDGIHYIPGVLDTYIEIEYEGALSGLSIDGNYPISLTTQPYWTGTDGQNYWAPFYVDSSPEAIDDDGSPDTVATRIRLKANHSYTPPPGDTTLLAANYYQQHGLGNFTENVFGNYLANAELYFSPAATPSVLGQPPGLPILKIRQVRTWRHFAYANPPAHTPQTPEVHLDTYETRTGLVSNPGTSRTEDGWQIYAACCDIVSRPSGNTDYNAVYVVVKPPDDFTGTAVDCDLAFNCGTLVGFNSIPIGGNLPGDYGLGPDITVGMQLTANDDGTWSNLVQFGETLACLTNHNYYDTLQRGLADVSGHDPQRAGGSVAAGTFVPPAPGGDDALYFVGNYFLLAAEIRVTDIVVNRQTAISTAASTTYPNFPGSKKTISVVFSLGKPLALKMTASEGPATYSFD